MKGKRETIKNLISIQERVNRLFEDVLVDMEATGEGRSVSWSPRVDIYETEDEFVVNAELPGVKEKNLDIKVEGNALVIKGYRPHLHDLSSEESEGKYHMVECTYGAFKRSFLLPESVDCREDHGHAQGWDSQDCIAEKIKGCCTKYKDRLKA